MSRGVRVLLLVAIVAAVLDASLTYYAVQHLGGGEANPLMHEAMFKLDRGPAMALRAVAGILLAYLLARLASSERSWVQWAPRGPLGTHVGPSDDRWQRYRARAAAGVLAMQAVVTSTVVVLNIGAVLHLLTT